MKNLLTSLHGETALCIAMDVTGKDEYIATKLVNQWRLQTIELPKKPAVFLFLA
jgi:16S rRNA (cytidine1402-2'-O)-methyltransferase